MVNCSGDSPGSGEEPMVPGDADFSEHVRGEERSEEEVMVQAIKHREGQRHGGVELCSGVDGGHGLAQSRAMESQGRVMASAGEA
jgi:hypothetical protein